jgi:hypothetical protein
MKLLLFVFIAGLVLSGVTAIPLETELKALSRWAASEPERGKLLSRIRDAVVDTKYPCN